MIITSNKITNKKTNFFKIKDKQIKELTQDISIDNEIDKQLTLFPQKQNSK